MERATSMLAVVSAAVTILITAWGAFNGYQVQANKEAVDKATNNFERQIKERVTNREDYEFVKGLTAELSGQDEVKRSCAKALIRFVLKDDEEREFFASLSQSGNQDLKAAGEDGLKKVDAKDKEKKGFDQLADGKFDEAQKSFSDAETVSPTYHSVSEINSLLKTTQNETKTSDAAKKEVLQKIVKDYSWKMSPETKIKLEKAAKP